MFSWKSPEFYIAILASALFVFESNKEKPFWSRFLITVSSAGFGFSLSPDLAEYVGASQTLIGILVTALGFLILEVSAAIVSDIEFVKRMIEKKVE